MKILLLGVAGMAGHMIVDYLGYLKKYKIITQARDRLHVIPDYYCEVGNDIGLLQLYKIILIERPDIIINCIGLLVQACKENPRRAIYLNSYFPHWLEDITKNTTIKIIHLSTDCIFGGDRGHYSETDCPTETSWYGRSKALGEIINNKDLTLRTSIIGPELKQAGTGLLHWFLQQYGEVRGFSECLWTGLTTLQLAKSIDNILTEVPSLAGIYHLVPNMIISKYDLLSMIARIWNKTDINLVKDETVKQNKSLINNRLSEYNPGIPDYGTQLKELYVWIEINKRREDEEYFRDRKWGIP